MNGAQREDDDAAESGCRDGVLRRVFSSKKWKVGWILSDEGRLSQWFESLTSSWVGMNVPTERGQNPLGI